MIPIPFEVFIWSSAGDDGMLNCRWFQTCSAGMSCECSGLGKPFSGPLPTHTKQSQIDYLYAVSWDVSMSTYLVSCAMQLLNHSQNNCQSTMFWHSPAIIRGRKGEDSSWSASTLTATQHSSTQRSCSIVTLKGASYFGDVSQFGASGRLPYLVELGGDAWQRDATQRAKLARVSRRFDWCPVSSVQSLHGHMLTWIWKRYDMTSLSIFTLVQSLWARSSECQRDHAHMLKRRTL